MFPEEVRVLGSGLLCHELTLGAGSPAPASLSCGCGLLWLHNEVPGFEMPQDKRGSSSQGQAYQMIGGKTPIIFILKHHVYVMKWKAKFTSIVNISKNFKLAMAPRCSLSTPFKHILQLSRSQFLHLRNGITAILPSLRSS